MALRHRNTIVRSQLTLALAAALMLPAAAFAQDQAIVHGKVWPGYKLVEGRSNRKYTSDEEVEEAAKAAGYTDIYKRSLIGIGEMEKLMGKDEFARILGSLIYKPQGKVTLAPDADKREAINKTTALADFQEV